MRSRFHWGRIAATALETVAWVGLATALVALLNPIATAAGLGSIYLIAVLAVAIRRGQIAALAAALLGVLTLNFFFIEPLHQLTIAQSDNVVALGVLLVAALVVGRLAASRERAAEAERRADQAAARESEAAMLAEAATAALGGHAQVVSGIASSLHAAGADELRLESSSAPQARQGETVLRLPTRTSSVWLYAGELVGLERGRPEPHRNPARPPDRCRRRAGRAADRGAEAEAARQADAAKTVILHAISHDLRSPLTAIRTAAAGLREEGTAADDRSR